MQEMYQTEQWEKKGLLNIHLGLQERENSIQRFNNCFHLMCIVLREAVVVRGQTLGIIKVQALAPWLTWFKTLGKLFNHTSLSVLIW